MMNNNVVYGYKKLGKKDLYKKVKQSEKEINDKVKKLKSRIDDNSYIDVAIKKIAKDLAREFY